MNETQPLPTDAEIDALLRPFYESDDAAEMAKYDDRLTARAVLAKWGTPPAVAVEPFGWVWQHEETGRTGFVDCWQVENGWQENNPRLRLVSKLYTTPQPTQAGKKAATQAQAAAEPVAWFQHKFITPAGTRADLAEVVSALLDRQDRLEALITKLHAAKGRYHTQLVCCDLFDAVGLKNERPVK